MRRGLWLPFFLLFGCASAERPVETDEPSPTVALVFGWKPGSSAQVVAEATRLRQIGDRETRHVLRASYLLSTVAEGDDLRIQSSDLQVTFEPEAATLDEHLGALVAEVSSLSDLLVSRDGRFEGIPDPLALRARIEPLFSKMSPTARGGMLDLVQTLLGERKLLSRASERWGGLVGLWIDGELEPGRTYIKAQRVDHLVFPQIQLWMKYEFTLRNVLPCTREGREFRCVELRMHATSDPDDAARAVESFMHQAGARPSATGAPIFTEAATEHIIRLVTEPDGLIPHAYSDTVIVKGVGPVDGESRAMRRETRVEYSFRY